MTHSGMQDNGSTYPRKPMDLLFSFYYTRDTNMQEVVDGYERKPFIIADSGGFSAHSIGAEVDIAEYADWLHKWPGVVDVAANLDIKGNLRASERNLLYLESRGLQAMPVFHGGEDLGVLREMVASYPVVFVGNIAGTLPSNHPKVVRFLHKCFEIAGDTKLHGFGATSSAMIKRFPWWSVDSTSWKAGLRYGQIPVYNRVKHEITTWNLGAKEWGVHAAAFTHMTGLDWRNYAYRERLSKHRGEHYGMAGAAAFEAFRMVHLQRVPAVPAPGMDAGPHICLATMPSRQELNATRYAERAQLHV